MVILKINYKADAQQMRKVIDATRPENIDNHVGTLGEIPFENMMRQVDFARSLATQEAEHHADNPSAHRVYRREMEDQCRMYGAPPGLFNYGGPVRMPANPSTSSSSTAPPPGLELQKSPMQAATHIGISSLVGCLPSPGRNVKAPSPNGVCVDIGMDSQDSSQSTAAPTSPAMVQKETHHPAGIVVRSNALVTELKKQEEKAGQNVPFALGAVRCQREGAKPKPEFSREELKEFKRIAGAGLSGEQIEDMFTSMINDDAKYKNEMLEMQRAPFMQIWALSDCRHKATKWSLRFSSTYIAHGNPKMKRHTRNGKIIMVPSDSMVAAAAIEYLDRWVFRMYGCKKRKFNISYLPANDHHKTELRLSQLVPTQWGIACMIIALKQHETFAFCEAEDSLDILIPLISGHRMTSDDYKDLEIAALNMLEFKLHKPVVLEYVDVVFSMHGCSLEEKKWGRFFVDQLLFAGKIMFHESKAALALAILHITASDLDREHWRDFVVKHELDVPKALLMLREHYEFLIWNEDVQMRDHFVNVRCLQDAKDVMIQHCHIDREWPIKINENVYDMVDGVYERVAGPVGNRQVLKEDMYSLSTMMNSRIGACDDQTMYDDLNSRLNDANDAHQIVQDYTDRMNAYALNEAIRTIPDRDAIAGWQVGEVFDLGQLLERDEEENLDFAHAISYDAILSNHARHADDFNHIPPHIANVMDEDAVNLDDVVILPNSDEEEGHISSPSTAKSENSVSSSGSLQIIDAPSVEPIGSDTVLNADETVVVHDALKVSKSQASTTTSSSKMGIKSMSASSEPVSKVPHLSRLHLSMPLSSAPPKKRSLHDMRSESSSYSKLHTGANKNQKNETADLNPTSNLRKSAELRSSVESSGSIDPKRLCDRPSPDLEDSPLEKTRLVMN